jgi:hypothetical protein
MLLADNVEGQRDADAGLGSGEEVPAHCWGAPVARRRGDFAMLICINRGGPRPGARTLGQVAPFVANSLP